MASDGNQQAVREFRVDRQVVLVYRSRAEMGRAAAHDIADALRRRLRDQPGVRMVFAAAPSQDAMLASLAQSAGIDWARVTALHMDEYAGLDETAPQRFGNYLKDRLFDHVRPGRVELISPNGDAALEAERYARVLAAGPIDIVCAGIGENGHIAFNDPGIADFADAKLVKVVALDERSRQQQVNDQCFTRLADVPSHAITMTVPALLSAGEVFCVVPGASKAAAVRQALYGPVAASCPASVLRRHERCTLYLDADSAPRP
jgi:glucosamine-6-phosphate deaminase